MSQAAQYRVGILAFPDAEVLDVCGPFEAFSVAGYVEGQQPYDVKVIAESPGPVVLRNGLQIEADWGFRDCPPLDVLVVAGGPGARPQSRNERLLSWLRERSGIDGTLLSICTGALILGRAGLLDGMEATTHHRAFDELREAAPSATIHEGVRFIWNDNLILSAGVASGIDASLEVIARYSGEEIAASTGRYMEFPRGRS